MMHDVLTKHREFADELNQADVQWIASQLQSAPAATTVRTNGEAQPLHDRPFAEPKQELTGFYLVDAADLDAAIGWARKIPVVGHGSIEVRALVQM
jgi:hypothetical protein